MSLTIRKSGLIRKKLLLNAKMKMLFSLFSSLVNKPLNNLKLSTENSQLFHVLVSLLLPSL